VEKLAGAQVVSINQCCTHHADVIRLLLQGAPPVRPAQGDRWSAGGGAGGRQDRDDQAGHRAGVCQQGGQEWDPGGGAEAARELQAEVEGEEGLAHEIVKYGLHFRVWFRLVFDLLVHLIVKPVNLIMN
jgi:hypothetical protein